MGMCGCSSLFQVCITRTGNVWGIPFTLSKAVTLSAGSNTVEIGYRLEDLPNDFCQHLAVEFNFAGLPAQAKGRCFKDKDGLDLGHLGTLLDLKETSLLSLEDEWLDIRVSLECGVASNGGLAGKSLLVAEFILFKIEFRGLCLGVNWRPRGEKTTVDADMDTLVLGKKGNGLFDNCIDMAYILTMKNSERIPQFIKQLNYLIMLEKLNFD